MDPSPVRVQFWIRDKKGLENVVKDHLSRLLYTEENNNRPQGINDTFPKEHLCWVQKGFTQDS